MTDTFLIKYGEIGIKGSNRHLFESALCEQIRRKLSFLDGDFAVTHERGRIYVRASGEFGETETLEALSQVFGIVGICPVRVLEPADYGELKEQILCYMEEEYGKEPATFKVRAKRISKLFGLRSMEMDADLGEAILARFPNLRVDVHTPDILLDIEVRDKTYVYSRMVRGPGGMPLGTGGTAMLLLSGGIDSPVAGWMVAKRGVKLDAVYFHAPPYTSERAKQKVLDLARKLLPYTGPIRLHIVNFTDIQLAIYDRCPHEELTIIMRRYMMRIAERLAEKDRDLGLVTGESIGQVASQTMQSLAVTDAAVQLPVYRPLIGFDKNEIVSLAKKIGTFETSILPYEDCCTIFVAKHPVTKPIRSVVERSEGKLKDVIAELTERAVETAETVLIREGGGQSAEK